MLDLRPNCECCDRDIAPDSRDAFICTFECTFCRDCAEGELAGTCPPTRRVRQLLRRHSQKIATI